MVVLAVVWVARPGHEDEVANVFRKLEAESRREPGCLMYIVHRQKDQPGRFFIYEQYKDDAALQAHRESLHFQHYAVTGLANIADRVMGELYQPLTSE
ncbi:MAG: putative quinol monooxygenase [Candidatus Korobacteraceae bacterium]